MWRQWIKTSQTIRGAGLADTWDRDNDWALLHHTGPPDALYWEDNQQSQWQDHNRAALEIVFVKMWEQNQFNSISEAILIWFLCTENTQTWWIFYTFWQGPYFESGLVCGPADQVDHPDTWLQLVLWYSFYFITYLYKGWRKVDIRKWVESEWREVDRVSIPLLG